jgi:N-acetylmuramoyl-L-alanine amidase
MMKKWTITMVATIGIIGLGMMIPTGKALASTPILAQGSSNGDVWDLQYRLYSAGFYNQPLDGKFGPLTKEAVMAYQRSYGLAVDGIVGTQTWTSLKKFSLNKDEMEIMARIIYSEARGETYTGQVAVGAVVMNRIQSPDFGNNIKDVVFEPGAFVAVADGQFNLIPNAMAYTAALDAVRGWDPTGNAIYYFNPLTATNKWILTRTQTVKIGNHIFAK